MAHVGMHEAEFVLLTILIVLAPFVSDYVTAMLPIDTTKSWAATAAPWVPDTAHVGGYGLDWDRTSPV